MFGRTPPKALYRLYQMYDRVARQVDGPIMQFRNDSAAVRTFHDVLGNRNTTPGQHPGDYDLYCVGEQDAETGVVTPATPEVVATGISWVEGVRRASAQLELTGEEVAAHANA